jgi:DNA invertase Pin-like site-specific DNA recombinase
MRYRRLTPEQGAEVARALAAGATARQLAEQYGVSQRTIWRTLNRATEPRATVEVFGHRATFVQGDDLEPVRMTPWTPADG